MLDVSILAGWLGWLWVVSASCTTARVEEEDKVMEALKKNGYPLGFFEQCIRRAHRTKLPSTSQQPPDRIYIPYVQGQSEGFYTVTTSPHPSHHVLP